MLNLAGKRCVVVGSGAVARRKVRALLDAGAVVRVVSPNPPGDIPPGVEILAESYQPAHLAGAMLVFACTNDPAVNSHIAADARKNNTWVCAVDQPADCDFFNAAVAMDGDVIVAVGTGGACPHLARRLADQMQTALPESIGAFAACVGDLREELQTAKLPDDIRRNVLRELSSEETYRVFLTTGPAGVRQQCESLLAQKGGAPCDSCA